MPITAQDLQPFLSQNNQAGNYPYLSLGNYNSGSVAPTSGGWNNNGGYSNGFLGNFNLGSRNNDVMASTMMPFGPLFMALGFGGLFGGNDEPTWSPYSQNGMYYWANPKSKNPVPNASVPGAALSPSSSYTKMANNTQAILDLMPYMSQAVNQTAVPTALSQLAAAQATSPGYAQLMVDMYNTYGPQLNAIGNEILGRNMLAEAKNQLGVLQGPGQDLVKSAYDLSQIYDKPYYDTRARVATGLNDLFNSIDLTGGLSNTERDEIAKGLARSNAQRGTLNSPSPINTVADAMQYGQAGYQRKTQQQNLLSDAIKQSSSFLPTAKSGVDVFQVATGKSSMGNPGNSLFPGINNASNGNAYGLAGNLLNAGTTYDTTQMNIDANKKDWLDQFNQFASGLGSLTGSAKGMFGV